MFRGRSGHTRCWRISECRGWRDWIQRPLFYWDGKSSRGFHQFKTKNKGTVYLKIMNASTRIWIWMSHPAWIWARASLKETIGSCSSHREEPNKKLGSQLSRILTHRQTSNSLEALTPSFHFSTFIKVEPVYRDHNLKIITTLVECILRTSSHSCKLDRSQKRTPP